MVSSTHPASRVALLALSSNNLIDTIEHRSNSEDPERRSERRPVVMAEPEKNLTFCYVLVEIDDGPLGEATYISCSLLRRLYHSSPFVLLCDPQTEATLAAKRLPFAELGVEIRAFVVPNEISGSPARSRFLKTQIRELINGDLVYLDADAIPLRPFDGLFEHEHQFAAVLDRNAEIKVPHMPTWVEPIYREFGWPYPVSTYFNSGVMFWQDDALMRELGRLWHKRWRDVLARFGKHQDQPSLNSAIYALGVNTKVLPIQYNAMVDSSLFFARNARIVHYFFSGRHRRFDPDSVLQHMIDEWRAANTINWENYRHALDRSDAWIHPTKSIMKEIASHHYLRAIQLVIERGLRRVVP